MTVRKLAQLNARSLSGFANVGAQPPNVSPFSTTGRVVICGSMSFFAEMKTIQGALLQGGVSSILPNPDSFDPISTPGPIIQIRKRQAALAHIRRIRSRSTFGILVVNFDKYLVENYIGPSTFTEIAVAAVQAKRVYLFTDAPAVYVDELSVWGATALHGSLEPLVADYLRLVERERAQLSLF